MEIDDYKRKSNSWSKIYFSISLLLLFILILIFMLTQVYILYLNSWVLLLATLVYLVFHLTKSNYFLSNIFFDSLDFTN